jgi:hypothetical protein
VTQSTAFIGPLPSEPDDGLADPPQQQRKPGDDPFGVPPGGLLEAAQRDALANMARHGMVDEHETEGS